MRKKQYIIKQKDLYISSSELKSSDDFLDLDDFIIVDWLDCFYFEKNKKNAILINGKLIFEIEDTIDNLIGENKKYKTLSDYEKDKKIQKQYPNIQNQLDAIWEILIPREGTNAYRIQDMIFKIKGIERKENVISGIENNIIGES
jgi:hypothetical protein